MTRPQTYTDKEMHDMIVTFYLDNGRYPTIAEVKKMGCGDMRAQRILKESKAVDPHIQPQPQPQPQPIRVDSVPADIEVDYADFTGARWFYLLPGEFEKCPDWIKRRLKTL